MNDNRIKAGSYSRLQIFESCPHRAKLQYIDRIKEPERPPLPNGKEYPNDRGSRVHDYAEFFVRGLEGFEDLIPELMNFEAELLHIRNLFRAHPERFVMEDMWLFNNTWTPLPADAPIDDIWMRIKLDLLLFSPCKSHATVVDYKTGKRYGNEVKHADQTRLYALAAFLRYPDLEEVTTELWYLDQDELATMSFLRRNYKRLLRNWNDKMLAMTEAEFFPVKANVYSCRFCPYKTGLIGKFGPPGTGDCSRNPV